MCDIFETRNLDYNIRSQRDFVRMRVNTSSFGLSFLKYLTTKIWDIVPYEIKSVGNINLFKKKIKIGNLRMSFQAMQTISSRCRICGHFLIFIVFKNHCYFLRYK